MTKLPKETIERIEKDAKAFAGNMYNRNHFPVNWNNRKKGYIAGAVAEAERDQKKQLPETEWIVNDSGELGVKIGNRFLFLYKGFSLEYKSGKHDDGLPMFWRHVRKREFGECCHPLDFWDLTGKRKYTNFKEQSLLDSDDSWQPLPEGPKEK